MCIIGCQVLSRFYTKVSYHLICPFSFIVLLPLCCLLLSLPFIYMKTTLKVVCWNMYCLYAFFSIIRILLVTENIIFPDIFPFIALLSESKNKKKGQKEKEKKMRLTLKLHNITSSFNKVSVKPKIKFVDCRSH